jgi:hypothetical protein
MLNSKLRNLIFVLGFACPWAIAGEQVPSLFVAGVELRLGMPRATVLSKLEGKTLTKTGTDGWIITEKKGSEFLPVGGIGFKDDKLTWLSRDWGNFDSRDSAIDLSLELFRVFSYLDAKGERIIHISTSTFPTPGMTFKSIEVQSTERKVTIGIVEGKETGSVGIQEIIEVKR